jgi:hypothetical protein
VSDLQPSCGSPVDICLEVAFIVGNSMCSLHCNVTHGHTLDVAALRSCYHSGQGGTMVCDLGLLSLTFGSNRSNGSGRSSSAFNPSGYLLDTISQAPMAVTQSNFHSKSIYHHDISFVRHVRYLCSCI